MEVDDPWYWGIDRIVKELCTKDRSWKHSFSSDYMCDPTELEAIIRKHDIDGFGILNCITDETLREMDLATFKRKKWIICFMIQLQERSPTWQRKSLETSYRPTYTPIDRKRVAEDDLLELQSKKPRLAVENDSSAFFDPQPPHGFGVGNNINNSHVETTPDVAPGSEISMQDTPELIEEAPAKQPVKKRRRIAPTFVRPLDPDRLRSISPATEATVIDGTSIDGDEPETSKEPVPKVQPGKMFMDEKTGKKRMIPIHQADSVNMSQKEPEQTPDGAKDVDGKSATQDEILTHGDLGKIKIPVDDIFYGNLAGLEIEEDLPEDFQFCGRLVSSGRRLYVNSVMRRFLKQNNLTRTPKFSRNGKSYSAIVPYPLRLVPQRQERFFTLLYKSDDGEFHSSKQTVSKWPELIVDDSKSLISNNMAGMVPKAVDSQQRGGIHLPSEMNIDYDQLEEKYANLPEDTLLPLFGDSGSEGEYDYDTWKEMETERMEKENSPLERPLLKSKGRPISPEEINSAIDDAIAELVKKWQTRKLPKLASKAWSTYQKYRNRRNHRKRQLKQEILHLNEDRIPKQRKEMAGEVWTRAEQVRKQAMGSMEVTIFDRELKLWQLNILKSKTAPPKPIVKPTKVKKEENLLEGEELIPSGSEDESGGEFDDFLDDDEDLEDVPGEISVEDDSTDSSEDEGESNKDIVPEQSAIPNIQPVSKPGPSSDLLFRNDDDRAADMSTEDELKLPPSTPKASRNKKQKAELIDLTMLSSSPERPKTPQPRREMSPVEHVDLVTPKDEKKIAITFKRKDRPRNIVVISDSESQHPLGSDDSLPIDLPHYRDTAAIARIDYATWERLQDRNRLIITFIHNMTPHEERAKLLMQFTQAESSDMWMTFVTVLHALHYNTKVERMTISLYTTFVTIVRLFKMYVECKYLKPFVQVGGEYVKVTASFVSDLEKQKDLFSGFYETVSEVANGMQGDKDNVEEGQEKEGSKKKLPTIKITGDYKENDEEEDTDDDAPILTRPKRLSPYKNSPDLSSEPLQLSSNESSNETEDEHQLTPSRRKKRQIVENQEARELREANKERLEQQNKRRLELQAKLKLEGLSTASSTARLIINEGKHDDEGFIYIDEAIGQRIKPHQILGVRFMWEQIVTDAKNMQGCLLAHTMGLGKTMQVITLLVAIAEASKSEDESVRNQIPLSLRTCKVLVLCPPTLVDNWEDELLIWAPRHTLGDPFKLSARIKIDERLRIIAEWYQDGGVLIIGYAMFRQLLSNKATKKKPSPLSEDQFATLRMQLLQGPSIIVADEAHMLKNTQSAISNVTSQFASKSRIALTGSPLNNNIEEYHTMIDWVAPNYLGPVKEFRAKYREPIEAGLWFDSSREDRRGSKKMLAVLIQELALKVNRANMSVLRDDLPKKKEFVIRVALTPLQKEAYQLYVRGMKNARALDLVQTTKEGHISQTTLWSWLTMLSLLCNHPACFKNKLQGEQLVNSDEDQVASQVNDAIKQTGMQGPILDLLDNVPDILDPTLSNKVAILSKILDESRKMGDKVLVFSQSIPTLNYLDRAFEAAKRNYKRLDGQTDMSIRQGMVKEFNTGSTELFLISTQAGSLGLNLYAANRVVIFDFKYNPTQEEQAIGRAYRIGQVKPVFVYRFVVAGTFESKIENKAVFKMQLASRVVDKTNPLAWAKKSAAEYLADPVDVECEDLATCRNEDTVLSRVLDDPKLASQIRNIIMTDAYSQDDTEDLTAEDKADIERMSKDLKLEREDPKAFKALVEARAKEERAEWARKELQSIKDNMETAHKFAKEQHVQQLNARKNVMEPLQKDLPFFAYPPGRLPPSVRTPQPPFFSSVPPPQTVGLHSPTTPTPLQIPTPVTLQNHAGKDDISAPRASFPAAKAPAVLLPQHTPKTPFAPKDAVKNAAKGPVPSTSKMPSAGSKVPESNSTEDTATEPMSSTDGANDGKSTNQPKSANSASFARRSTRLPSWAHNNISKANTAAKSLERRSSRALSRSLSRASSQAPPFA